jgi:DNA-binding transcriptional LysR family regulator
MLFDRIELFVSVAKNQNLAKTARGMHVSASSVCQRLKSLENDFGVKLYRKSKEGIELTGAGQTFLSTVSDVLNQLETLKKTLNKGSEAAVQSLTIAGTSSPSAKYLPSAIATFQKLYPDIKMIFLTADRRSVEKWVRDCEVDIAMVQSTSESSEFNMEYFAEENLTFFAHPTHPFAKKKKLDLTDLTETPLVVREGSGATPRMLKQLKCRGVALNIVLRCISPDAVKEAIRRKTGVGILFYNQIEQDVKRKELKILNFSGLPKLVSTSYIVYSKRKPLSSAANDFLILLRSIKTRLKNPVSISEDRADIYTAT